MILQPVQNLQEIPPQPLAILVDALDEAHVTKQKSIAWVIGHLGTKLPNWLRIISTSREEELITAELYPIVPHQLETIAHENEADIAICLTSYLPDASESQYRQIISRSEGNFLYIRLCVDEISSGRLSPDNLDQLPRGLAGFYRQQFDRYFSGVTHHYKDENIRSLIRLLCTSFEPLDLGIVRSILGLKNREQLFDRLESLEILFPRTGDKDCDRISPMHRSVKDWICSRSKSGPYYVDIESGHEDLATYGWNEYQKNPENLAAYMYAWLPRHIAECGRKDDAAALLKDFNFMMARTKAGKCEQLLADYKLITHGLLKAESAFFLKFGHLIQDETTDWPAFKVLFQLAIEQKDDNTFAQSAQKYLDDGKCYWARLRVTKIQQHSGKITKFLALPDGRMMTRSSDRMFSLLDYTGNLLKQIDQRMDDTIGKIKQRNDGSFLTQSNKGRFYLYDQSMETQSRIYFPEMPDLDTAKVNECGSILFPGDNFLVWRSDDAITVISEHSELGEFRKHYAVPRVVSNGVKLIEKDKILIKYSNSALIINNNLDFMERFSVPEDYRGRRSDVSDDDNVYDFDYVGDGIFLLEEGRYLSGWEGSLFYWGKNANGIFEIETETKLGFSYAPGGLFLKKLHKMHYYPVQPKSSVPIPRSMI